MNETLSLYSSSTVARINEKILQLQSYQTFVEGRVKIADKILAEIIEPLARHRIYIGLKGASKVWVRNADDYVITENSRLEVELDATSKIKYAKYETAQNLVKNVTKDAKDKIGIDLDINPNSFYKSKFHPSNSDNVLISFYVK